MNIQIPTKSIARKSSGSNLNFIDGKRLIIHNAEFDLSHLNNELKISGNEILKNDIVDTLILARDKFPILNNSSRSIQNFLVLIKILKYLGKALTFGKLD